MRSRIHLWLLVAVLCFPVRAAAQKVEDCLVCHDSKDLTTRREGKEISLYVEGKKFLSSVHGSLACVDCHGDLQNRELPHEEKLAKVECGSCHADEQKLHAESLHGKAVARGDPLAPRCKDCHGNHDILPVKDPGSAVAPGRIPYVCGKCHQEGTPVQRQREIHESNIVANYSESMHGEALLKKGLVVAATCVSCHTAHRVLPHDNPESSVNPENVPSTCGKCHNGIEEQFEGSVHSRNVTKTTDPLPVCNDCHSAHTIMRTDNEGFKLTIMSQCGRCHETIAKTYFDTYHGKVSQLGYTKTAQCYDCHGSHDILKVTDPRSHLSRTNVVATCQKCHPGATRRFAGYLTHATHHDPAKYPWLFWTFWCMTGLLIGTFTAGGAHTLLWLPRALQMRRQNGRAPAAPQAAEYLRFTRLNRIQHAVMIVSFMSLALTGLTLKFSYTAWASTLSHLLGGFESAGYIHRVAASLMVGVFISHLVDLVRRKRREYGSWRKMLFGPDSMLPARKDLTDFIASIKWFLGIGARPRYGRWTYWEKFDYFAVFWGIAVIGLTGLTLWFPEFFTRFLPGWFLNVATIIHSDEALLATGFIFTVHFFNTHLRPEKFPMDIVVFTGRMPVEELRRDKPAEYEALVQKGELEKHLVEPYPAIVVKTIRVFAWGALALGFSMVIWIVYAMIFAYR
jgi:cytochrome b subunit of formate dehydrogenase